MKISLTSISTIVLKLCVLKVSVIHLLSPCSMAFTYIWVLDAASVSPSFCCGNFSFFGHFSIFYFLLSDGGTWFCFLVDTVRVQFTCVEGIDSVFINALTDYQWESMNSVVLNPTTHALLLLQLSRKKPTCFTPFLGKKSKIFFT